MWTEGKGELMRGGHVKRLLAVLAAVVGLTVSVASPAVATPVHAGAASMTRSSDWWW
jgi:hypothetical protein